MIKISITAVAFAIVSFSAVAHQVWLEPDGADVKLYFGEFGENLREVSPGLLDKFGSPTATRLSSAGDAPATLTKTANGFTVAAKSGDAVIAEDAVYPIMERKDGDRTVRTVYAPAARLVTDFRVAAPSKLTLDLVPTGAAGKDGIELLATFKGQPLPKAKVAIVTRSGWLQEHYTDEAGKLKVQLPWAGTYVLELQYQDKAAGTRANGDAYDRASYVTSVTLLQPKGVAALPAPPAAKPN